MTTLASLQKSLRHGGMSVWTFNITDDSRYYSCNNDGKKFFFDNVDKMRTYYRTMISYGFRPSPIDITDD